MKSTSTNTGKSTRRRLQHPATTTPLAPALGVREPFCLLPLPQSSFSLLHVFGSSESMDFMMNNGLQQEDAMVHPDQARAHRSCYCSTGVRF